MFDPGQLFGGVWQGNGCAMRFFTGGQSWMHTATFTVNNNPQSWVTPLDNWSMLIYHLSSSPDGVNPGYSPVRVTLNGTTVYQGSPGATGSGLWTLSTGSNVGTALRQGTNVLRWDFLSGATTHYWLKSFRIAMSRISR